MMLTAVLSNIHLKKMASWCAPYLINPLVALIRKRICLNLNVLL